MKSILFVTVLIVLPVITQAADIQRGKQLSSSCQSCHGATGISVSPLYPNLARQKAPYLIKQMRDFKTGKRQDPVMSAMVKSFSEQDMSNIAEYYSQQQHR